MSARKPYPSDVSDDEWALNAKPPAAFGPVYQQAHRKALAEKLRAMLRWAPRAKEPLQCDHPGQLNVVVHA